MHMACTGYQYNDFVIWAPDLNNNNAAELHIECIENVDTFFNALLPQIRNFILLCILPQL